VIETTVEPLFSNDLAGFVKAALMIAGPIFAGVLLYLKIGSREKISATRRDFEKADEDLKESITEAKRIAERATDLVKNDINGLGSRVDNLVTEMTRIRTDVDAVKKSITESQRDIMTAIAASSEAQLRAVHDSNLSISERFALLRVDVGRLQERGDVAGRLADSIESLALALKEQRAT
jgi:uncharacterized protein YoxC